MRERSEAAMATHAGIAARLCQEAPSVRKVLISTDNVFDGQDTSYDESQTPNPANAYGRAKLAAEHVLLSADPSALVVRTSLVYGYEPQGPGRGWRNFFMVVAEAVRAGQPVQAPVDHWNTPILVDDAAAVLARLIPGSQAGLLHRRDPTGRPASNGASSSPEVWARTPPSCGPWSVPPGATRAVPPMPVCAACGCTNSRSSPG
ncbi:sugar nucleotide-binding protein [Cystobacter fuscus]